LLPSPLQLPLEAKKIWPAEAMLVKIAAAARMVVKVCMIAEEDWIL
jgi:hypothetical protein